MVLWDKQHTAKASCLMIVSTCHPRTGEVTESEVNLPCFWTLVIQLPLNLRKGPLAKWGLTTTGNIPVKPGLGPWDGSWVDLSHDGKDTQRGNVELQPLSMAFPAYSRRTAGRSAGPSVARIQAGRALSISLGSLFVHPWRSPHEKMNLQRFDITHDRSASQEVFSC